MFCTHAFIFALDVTENPPVYIFSTDDHLYNFFKSPQSHQVYLILQETKDLETASVASSGAGSVRGRPTDNGHGSTMDLSSQQTQVEVNT